MIRALLLLLVLLVHGASAATVRDMEGRETTFPAHPARLADLWFAHNAVSIMLGAADDIVVTCDKPSDLPWMFEVAPGLRRASWMSASSPNVETLLARGVQGVFFSGGALRARLAPSGLPLAALSFTDETTLLRSVELTARLLDTPQAKDVAAAYADAVTTRTRELARRFASLPDGERPRVLHVESVSPLRVDGTGTIIDSWIRAGGGRNAVPLIGVKRPVTIEQIAAWDPDVIVLTGIGAPFDPARAGGVWAQLRAVRNGRVARVPVGVFPWDRFGPEYLLQVDWAAKLFYPDRTEDVDLLEETRAFYRRFYHHALTRDQAARILADQSP